MSAARRLPVITSILAAGLAMVAGSVPSIRASVARTTGLSAPGGTWRVIAIILAILNVKNLPFVWHIRLFRSLFYHLYIQRTELPPSALFLPLITASHTPIAETDYNFHKSNSTYFTDLDIARTHLVTAILVKGIRGMGKYPENKTTGWSFANTTRAAGRPRTLEKPGNEANDEKAGAKEKATERQPKPAFLQINALAGSGNTESGVNTPTRSSTPQPCSSPPSQSHNAAHPQSQQPQPDNTKAVSRPPTETEWWSVATQPGNLLIALGGNACIYHREIPIYKRFEIWTRVLSWDRKWVYLVSHFVEAGAFKPPRYVLQPWKGAKPWVVKGEKMNEFKGMSEEEKRSAWRRKIYASSVSKYVVKKGRLTIPPELVLQRSEMLPPKPPGAKSAFEVGYMPPAKTEDGTPESGSTLDALEDSLFQTEDSDDEWTWEKCERMRLKGLKLAQHFDAMDGLREAFDGGEDGVMGVFTDLIGNI